MMRTSHQKWKFSPLDFFSKITRKLLVLDYTLILLWKSYSRFCDKQAQNYPGIRKLKLVAAVFYVALYANQGIIITARKRSLGQGNIFAPVCHSVQGGGWYPSMHCRSYHSMPCSSLLGGGEVGGIPACLAGFQAYTQGWCLGGSGQGVPALEGAAQGDACSGGGVWTPRDGYCCGRYASYWNAFLFYLNFIGYLYTYLNTHIYVEMKYHQMVVNNQIVPFAKQGS